jgi:hypothetical protein
MSDSPKCSTPSLRDQEEQRLRAERERLAAEENARRHAEAERIRRERIEQLRVIEELRARRREALENLADLQGEVEALKSDAVTMRWKHDAVDALETAVARAAREIDAGAFDAPISKLRSMKKTILVIVAEAQERQLAEDRRQYIVNGLMTVLGQMGFVLSADSPRHGDASPSSDVMLSARRLGGGAVAVSIPLEGEVLYDVEGYAKRKETHFDGAVTATCDEAEAEIQHVHDALARDFGIQMSELTWAGKPVRSDKQAEALPRGGSRGRERT